MFYFYQIFNQYPKQNYNTFFIPEILNNIQI